MEDNCNEEVIDRSKVLGDANKGTTKRMGVKSKEREGEVFRAKNFMQIPHNLIHEIFMYLPLFEIVKQNLVCKEMNKNVLDSEIFWESVCKRFLTDSNQFLQLDKSTRETKHFVLTWRKTVTFFVAMLTKTFGWNCLEEPKLSMLGKKIVVFAARAGCKPLMRGVAKATGLSLASFSYGPSEKDSLLSTLFTASTTRNALDTCKELARLGCDVRAEVPCKGSGVTLLEHCVRMKHNRVVVWLIEEGFFSVNETMSQGLTLLNKAIAVHNNYLLPFLIAKGALVTPRVLFNAVRFDNVPAIRFLQARAPDMMKEASKDPYFSVADAFCYGQINAARHLLESGFKLNAIATQGFTPVHFAIKNRRLDMLELLKQHNVDWSLGSPLHYCLTDDAGDHNSDLLKKLLDLGAKCDTLHTRDKTTPLIFACERGNLRAVEHLLRAGANVNYVEDKQHRTPLIEACRGGHLEIVELLLKARARTMVHEISGHSPLSLACKMGHRKVVKLLIKKGADVNYCPERIQPLYQAVSNKHLEIVELLLKAKAETKQLSSGTNSLYHALENNDLAIARLLLGAGAKMSDVNEYYSHALGVCINKKKYDAAFLMLEFDVNTNVRMRTSGLNTPLTIAVLHNKPELVRKLLERKANANYKLSNGTTPLSLAIKRGVCGTIVEDLLKHGADPNALDEKLGTPIDQARAKSNDLFVKALLARGARSSKDLHSMDAQTGGKANEEAILKNSEPLVNNKRSAKQMEDENPTVEERQKVFRSPLPVESDRAQKKRRITHSVSNDQSQ